MINIFIHLKHRRRRRRRRPRPRPRPRAVAVAFAFAFAFAIAFATRYDTIYYTLYLMYSGVALLNSGDLRCYNASIKTCVERKPKRSSLASTYYKISVSFKFCKLSNGDNLEITNLYAVCISHHYR